MCLEGPLQISRFFSVTRTSLTNRLICKGHLNYTCDFITEFPDRTDPAIKIGMHIFSVGMHYGYECIHVSRVTYERLAHICFPVDSRSLFFDIQVLTLLLGKYTLFASANLCYPTTRLCSYFSTIFAAHICVYTRMMGCKRSFSFL